MVQKNLRQLSTEHPLIPASSLQFLAHPFPFFHPVVVFWCCCAALVLQSGVQRVFPGIHSHCDVSAAQREALLAAAHGQVNLIIMLDVSASMGFNQGCDGSAGMMLLMRDSGE